MKVKKTIWIPIVLGGVLGILDFVSLSVNFLILLGPFGATGPQEILVILTAALGGPLGLLVANFLQELGIYFFVWKGRLPPEQASLEILIALTDFIAHTIALLPVAYCYRFLYTSVKKLYTFVVGWILIIVIYYTLLVLLQAFLIGLVFPDIPPPSAYLSEFLVAVIISTLLIIALPRRYRKPLWYESKQAYERSAEIPDK